jgi:regulation of enolase protein 1 (concanavalin A-like superfamily)
MRHLIGVAALLAVAALTPSSLSFQEQRVKHWGDVSDPDKDCEIKMDGRRLRISVPGTWHDLSVEKRKINAPRVLQDVEGDFIVQVLISGTVHPGPNSTSQGLPFNGAGLLVWQDENNYARLERAGIMQGTQFVPYALFETRSKGRLGVSPSFKIPDRDTYLRLERRGSKILAAVGPDGIVWQALQPLSLELSNKLKVGVAAVNTSTDPFAAEFQELDVFVRQRAEGTQ